MNKKSLIIIICIIAVIVLVLTIALRINRANKPEEDNSISGTKEVTVSDETVNKNVEEIINNDYPNLKIKIDWESAPSQIDTYYFYDKMIVKVRNFVGGVMAEGSVDTDTKTIYYFEQSIDLSNLGEFINTLPETELNNATIIITDKDGKEHGMKDIESSNSRPYSKLEAAIKEITDKATRVDNTDVETKVYD